MKHVALIHTVASVCQSFPQMLRQELPEVQTSSILDEYLASDPDEKGYVSSVCRQRLFHHVQAAALEQPDLIIVSCSAMSETVQQLRLFFKTPLLTIDEAMIACAVEHGTKILVMATAASSAITTRQTIERFAESKKKTVQIDAWENLLAFEKLQQGDKAEHDRLVLKQAAAVSGYDLVVLAQASMAHLRQAVAQIVKVPVLSSPQLCIQQAREILEQRG